MLAGDLVYLDSAATSLKPRSVIAAVSEFYETSTGAISRAGHAVSEKASGRFEAARARIATFLNARSDQIIFTLNASDAILRVAEGLDLGPNDEVIVSVMEHHSNLLPWRRTSKVVEIGIDEHGLVDLQALRDAIGPRTKLIAITAASNVSGAVQPISQIGEISKAAGVPFLVDAAQLAGHKPMSLADMGCTFCAISGHKLLGPSGTGVLAMSDEGAAMLRPTRHGGGTVEYVGQTHFVEKTGPEAFELGSPNPEGAVGLSAAIDYLDTVGLTRIAGHISDLTTTLREGIMANPAFTLPFAPGHTNTGIVSFVPNSRMNIGQMAEVLSDSYHISLRHGHHCAQPFYQVTGAKPALRASLHLYNTMDDVSHLLAALDDIAIFCTP
jgi:cysteine desulfurase/selenocysteine lyase